MVYLNSDLTGIYPYFGDLFGQLRLTNCVTKKEYVFETVYYDHTNSTFTFGLDGEDTDIPNGIYEYEGTNYDGIVYISGLLQVGDFTPETNNYKNDKEFKQYEG